MRRVSSTENIVKRLREDIQLKSKLIAAYEIPTPEFDKLVPDEYYTLETKRYLLLKALNRDTTTTPTFKPSKAIDDLWCMFMTCIKEYYNFCNSIITEDNTDKFIEKISYDDERNPSDGFDRTIEEYKERFSEENLSTILWNPRYRDTTYHEVVNITKNSTGDVYHSPFYQTGRSYANTFRSSIDDTTVQIEDVVNDESTSAIKRGRSRSRSDSLVVSSPNASNKNETGSSGKRGRGRPPKSSKKLIGTTKCPKCTAAVGEDNHENKVDIYLDMTTNTETFGCHLGRCHLKK